MRFRRKKKSKKKKGQDCENDPSQSVEDKQSEGEPSQTPESAEQSEESFSSVESPAESPEAAPAPAPMTTPTPHSLTANGDMKAGTGTVEGSSSTKTPPPERKISKLQAFRNIFKPWKWRRRKKPSEKIEKTAIDLERKISVRTSREELIKRGVLKEVDENGQPIVPKEAPIPELDEDEVDGEAVKESKVDSSEDESCDYKQANGSAATTPTLSPHSCDGHLANNITGVGDGDNMVQTPPPMDNSISLSPEYQQRPLSGSATLPASSHNHYAEDMQRPESALVEPKQIRVMLPMDEKDRQIPVIQRTVQIPVGHGDTSGVHHAHYHYYSSLPHHHHHLQNQHHPPSPILSSQPLASPQVLISSAAPYSPVLNNNVYTPTGLTYPTPTLKSNLVSSTHQSFSPATPTGPEEVPIHEPDLQKKPIRSALKGSKSKEMLQQQLQQRLLEKQKQLQYAETVTTSVGPRGPGAYDHNSLSRAPPKVAPKPRAGLVNAVRVIDSHNKENYEGYDNVPDYDNLHSSDSDEDVQYDERDRESILAAKVQRTDSLAKFLNARPEKRVLIERNIIPTKSDHERLMDRNMISNRLNRRLSLRPTAEELENRNILHSQTHDDYMKEREEKKRTLIRKLSFRPTVDELKERKIIKFSDYIEMTDITEYDRRADKPWTRLTPKDKAAIRKELNEFKSAEMAVHDESRHLTRFHRP